MGLMDISNVQSLPFMVSPLIVSRAKINIKFIGDQASVRKDPSCLGKKVGRRDEYMVKISYSVLGCCLRRQETGTN